MEQNKCIHRYGCIPFGLVCQTHYSTERGATFLLETRYTITRKEYAMFIILAVLICLALLAFAGGDWFFSQFNSDELSNMGVEKR